MRRALGAGDGRRDPWKQVDPLPDNPPGDHNSSSWLSLENQAHELSLSSHVRKLRFREVQPLAQG